MSEISSLGSSATGPNVGRIAGVIGAIGAAAAVGAAIGVAARVAIRGSQERVYLRLGFQGMLHEGMGTPCM